MNLKESGRTCPFRSGTAPCPADLHARLPVRRTQTGNAQAGPFRSVSIDALDGRDVVKGELGVVEIDDGFTRRKPGRRRSNRGVPEIEVNENLADRIGLSYEGDDFHAAATPGTDERVHLVNAFYQFRPFSSVCPGRKPGLFDRCDGGLWRALSQGLAVAGSPVSVRVDPVHLSIEKGSSLLLTLTKVRHKGIRIKGRLDPFFAFSVSTLISLSLRLCAKNSSTEKLDFLCDQVCCGRKLLSRHLSLYIGREPLVGYRAFRRPGARRRFGLNTDESRCASGRGGTGPSLWSEDHRGRRSPRRTSWSPRTRRRPPRRRPRRDPRSRATFRPLPC